MGNDAEKITVICPQCGQELRAPACVAGQKALCPRCESSIDVPAGTREILEGRIPPKKRLTGKQKWAIGIAIVLGLVLFFMVVMYVRYELSETWGSEISAPIMAEEFVKDRLKAPASAKFPPISKATVTDLNNGKWRVESYVDSQNSFGVMIRTQYTCTMQKYGRHHEDGKHWALEHFEFR